MVNRELVISSAVLVRLKFRSPASLSLSADNLETRVLRDYDFRFAEQSPHIGRRP